MNNIALLAALVNFGIAAIRFYFCLKKRRLIAVAWFLIAYFAFFFIPLSTQDTFIHRQNFTLDTVQITVDSIKRTCIYVFLFNVFFLLSELIAWRLLGPDTRQKQWQLPKNSATLSRLSIAYLALLLIGTLWYGINSYQLDYRDYVEDKGNWGIVFFWAAAPFITFSALRKKYLVAFLGSTPYLYFAYLVKVRSFALFSIIPIAIIFLLQSSATGRSSLITRLKFVFFGAALALILLMCSVVILETKGLGSKETGYSFPDSGMPFGTAILMQGSDKYETRTGWDALNLFSRNLVNPFLRLYYKLSQDKEPEIIDPPVVMARLFEGVPKKWDVFLHYPTLWYGDAYLAFGTWGLLFAIFWAFYLTVLESIMTRNTVIFGLLLPYFSFHVYMLIRGAIAGSTTPFSYSAYISLIVALFAIGPRLFRESAFSKKAPKKQTQVNDIYLE